MSEAEQIEAKGAWHQAESAAVHSDRSEQDDEAKIDKAIVESMRKQMKWGHRDLHDALLAASVAVPSVPSMRDYLASLRAQYGTADTGFPAIYSPGSCARRREAWRPADRQRDLRCG